MVTRREALAGAGALALGSGLGAWPAFAQSVETLRVFVPAAPGGGWDQTARTMEQVLRADEADQDRADHQRRRRRRRGGPAAVHQPVEGPGNALMVGGMVMVGAMIANKSPVKLTQVTPIARLTGEFEALVVPAELAASRPRRTSSTRSRPIRQGSGGRRLGRRHRSHPARHDRRRRSACRAAQDQLRGVCGRRPGHRRAARQPGGGGHLRLRRVRRADQGGQAAPARDLAPTSASRASTRRR